MVVRREDDANDDHGGEEKVEEFGIEAETRLRGAGSFELHSGEVWMGLMR